MNHRPFRRLAGAACIGAVDFDAVDQVIHVTRIRELGPLTPELDHRTLIEDARASAPARTLERIAAALRADRARNRLAVNGHGDAIETLTAQVDTRGHQVVVGDALHAFLGHQEVRCYRIGASAIGSPGLARALEAQRRQPCFGSGANALPVNRRGSIAATVARIDVEQAVHLFLAAVVDRRNCQLADVENPERRNRVAVILRMRGVPCLRRNHVGRQQLQLATRVVPQVEADILRLRDC